MKADKEARHEDLQQEVVTELKSLRAALREVAEGFILCKEGEIETLSDYLLKMPSGRLKEIARPWMREARNLKLKPAKGRLKDLKNIDGLLHNLLNYVIEADDDEQKPKATNKKGDRRKGEAAEMKRL